MSDSHSDQRTRLNKLIADSGLASRRAADRLIEDGHVTVNGKRVFELGIKVDPKKDKIMVDGKPLKKQLHQLYLLFNKPRGVLSTMSDPEDRPNLSGYLEKVPGRVFPVGRLDWDSEGMILLTNDGDFAQKIMHPSKEVTKTYLVKINGQARPDQIQKLLKGVSIIGGRVSAKSIEKIKRPEGSDQYDWYKVVITEGKNRQLRQMFAKIGFDLLRLQRVAIGRLRLGAIRKGELVFLNEAAIQRVFLPDLPDEVRAKKSYKGRTASAKSGGASRKNPPGVKPAGEGSARSSRVRPPPKTSKAKTTSR